MAENDTDRNEPCDPDIDDTAAAPAYRMSRGRVALLAVLAILPVVLTALAQPFLPDSVPLHYGASGPDRWGSKGELFVAAGIITVIAFVLVTVYAVVEHQRETGREDWLVVDGPVTSMFPVFSICLAIIDCLDAAYVFAAFQLGGFSMPENMGSLIGGIVCLVVALSLLTPALYMLITGKGLSLVNFHPGTCDLEKRTGAVKQQARAIGGLLLFLTVIVLVELLVTVK